jgi:hypothetical protein
MPLSLPHTIVNGTEPDADEVMANFTALLNQANRTFTAGAQGTATNSAQTTNGTSTGSSTGTSQVVAVAVPSLLLITYNSIVLHSWSATKTSSIIGKIEPTVGGASVGSGAQFERFVTSAGDAGSERVPISGSQVIGLTAGSHTIELKWTQTISTGGGWCSVQMRDSGWSGLVIPQ